MVDQSATTPITFRGLFLSKRTFEMMVDIRLVAMRHAVTRVSLGMCGLGLILISPVAGVVWTLPEAPLFLTAWVNVTAFWMAALFFVLVFKSMASTALYDLLKEQLSESLLNDAATISTVLRHYPHLKDVIREVYGVDDNDLTPPPPPSSTTLN